MSHSIKVIIIVLSCFVGVNVNAQQWHFTINGNETYPIGNEQLGYYPILWYSSADDRGVLIGGFGAGVSYIRPLNEKIDIRYQANFQRSRFYDKPSIFTDLNGASLGAIIGVNTNLNWSFFALPQISISKKKDLNIGIGLGLRGVVYSRTDYGEAFIGGEKVDLNIRNNSLTPIIAFIPLELNYKKGRWMVTNRGEFSINSTSRLSGNKKERSFVFFIEVGFLLSGKKS